MTFQEAIDYLYGRLPLFQNAGDRAYKPGLESTLALCAALDNPHTKFRSVHVGGTNGKGSSSHMLASVLQAAGYRVGLYTSPHLKSFTERIRIDGQPIPDETVASLVKKYKPIIEKYSPSFFEVTVVMAFDYFASENIDVAVVEVGMGGRLDSTNVITPLLSLVTNVSFDHQQHLGNTLPLIATEKAGIVKPGVPFVLSETPADPEVLAVFVDKANRMGAEMSIGDRVFEDLETKADTGCVRLLNTLTDQESEYQLDLLGDYQSANVKGVLAALAILREKDHFTIAARHIESGLGRVVQSTGLKGRWQVLHKNPYVVADTAHNPAGLALTLAQFMRRSASSYRFVLGFVADKEVKKIIELLPQGGIYYFCQPSVQRAMSIDVLGKIVEKSGLKFNAFTNVNNAYSQALTDSATDDAIYVGGSTFVVADLDDI